MTRATFYTILLTIGAASVGIIAAGTAVGADFKSLFPRRAESVRNWEVYQTPGTPILEGDGSITIIEFSDFQCPFCARAQSTLQELDEKYPGRVRLVYRHLPLPGHENAVAAAQAAECANEQQRFIQYHDILFAQQDSIGLKSWGSFAAEAGVSDLEAFTDCVEAERHAQRVQGDAEVAAQLGFTGTPTFIVNGKVVRGAYPLEEFERHIR